MCISQALIFVVVVLLFFVFIVYTILYNSRLKFHLQCCYCCLLDVLVTPTSSLAAQLFLPSSPHPPPSFSSFATPSETTSTLSSIATGDTPLLTAQDADHLEEVTVDEESYEVDGDGKESGSVQIVSGPLDKLDGTVECVVQTVPDFLVTNLLQLFPGLTLPEGHTLNVIVLSQHTMNDMTSWSSEVEEERQQLLEHVSQWVG